MKYLFLVLGIIFLFFVLRAGELYTQLYRYKKFWERVNTASFHRLEDDKQESKYIALGDSTAQSIGASRPDNGYPGLILKELNKNGDYIPFNFSKSGAKISDVLNEQLPELSKLKLSDKDVITIEIGANDISDFDEKKFETQFSELLDNLPENTVVSNVPSFAGSRYASKEPIVKKANKIIAKVAARHRKNIADLYTNVSNNHGLRTFSIDLFHPSNYGYKTNWLPAFMKNINISGK